MATADEGEGRFPCVRNVCWEGGGVRCLAYSGAWKRMEELGLVSNVTRLAGSSGGAIMAVAVAVGYTADEMEQVLRNMDMSKMKDGSWSLMGRLWDLVFHHGMYKGDYARQWLGELIATKTGNPAITFQQVHDRYGKELILTGSNLNKRSLEFYSPTWTPDMPIRDAAHISMSIPLFYQPVQRQDPEGTALLVDGGLMNNYALDCFQRNGCCGCITEETLGFKLLSDGERKDSQIYHGFDQLDTLSSVVKAIVNSMMLQMERLYIKKNYWKQTVSILTPGISATDFDLTSEDKDNLYQWGYQACDGYWTARVQQNLLSS